MKKNILSVLSSIFDWNPEPKQDKFKLRIAKHDGGSGYTYICFEYTTNGRSWKRIWCVWCLF